MTNKLNIRKPIGFLTLFLVTLTLLLTVNCKKVEAKAKVSQNAPGFTLTDTYGKQHKLSDYAGKFVVLEWLNHECPYVKKHYKSGNMQSLQKKITQKDVIWLSVNSSAKGKQGNFAPDKANKMTKEKDAAPTAVLLDENGAVGRLYGAKTTPHLFVIDPEGTLIYAGAIDSINSTEQKDIPKSTNYVKEALDSAMKGKVIAQASTAPYGCAVKY